MPACHVSTTPAPLLSLRGLAKAYAAPVLVGIDLEIRAGEVHALVGANGAGKSTLAKIIAGLLRPDNGEMLFGGAPYAPAGKRDAEARGVHLVMQELDLIHTLTVAENLHLNRFPRRFGFVRFSTMDKAARAILPRVGLTDLDPRTPVGQLGIGRRQLLEIAAALSRRCRLLILDEPTAALTDPQIDRLFDELTRLKHEGTGMLYISHRMEEFRRIADRVTVLRDGQKVATHSIEDLSPPRIVREMVGRELREEMRTEPRSPGPAALRVNRLCRGRAVRDVSFEVRQGEILGMAGLIGSGRTETLRAIYGADRLDSGEIFVGGTATPRALRSPAEAVRAGIGMIPEDRKDQALLLSQPVRVNTTLARMSRVARVKTWIDAKTETATAEDWCDRLQVQRHSVEQAARELSGGNQQKVVIARWLLRDCPVLLFDEPTRGVDVAAKWTIYRLLKELAGAGKAVVVASSELNELMALCDRIVVLSAGRLVANFKRPEWTREKLLAAAFQEHLKPVATT